MQTREIITDQSGSTYLVEWSTRRMAVLMADEWSTDGAPDPAKLTALADYELDEEITGEPDDYRHIASA